jgi:hypothetical protein
LGEKEINREIHKALECLGIIETSKITMFATDDKYCHPPFLRFRYKGVDKKNKIYDVIKNGIVEFKGNLKWDLITKESSKNYIIVPIVFEKYIEEGDFYNKKNSVEFNIEEYEKFIDAAIDDIPNLAVAIRTAR